MTRGPPKSTLTHTLFPSTTLVRSCYASRFPDVVRSRAQAGGEGVLAPAGFTKVTGGALWHVLQRARAIETGCYVVSAAQTGEHAEGRRTYGHFVIVDPWGRVVADAGEEVGDRKSTRLNSSH